jgi:hypothetical protein
MRVVIAIAILLVLDGEGRAQPAKAAEEAFEKGRQLMEAKSYADACAAFELSQRLDPQFGTQYNLAGCYAAQDKIATAWKLYRELARGDTNAQRRARSSALAAQLGPRVPKLRIRVEPAAQLPGLKVLVGATDVTSLVGAEIPFDRGHYVVDAQLPGHRPFRAEIDVDAPGRVRELAIAFEREAATPAGPARPGGAGDRADPGEPGAWRGRYGTLALAGGGGLFAFGLFAGWRALANRDESRNLCNTETCPDRPGSVAAVDRARLWGNLSTATVLVGAIGIAGGIYLWRTSRVGSVQVAPAAGPASASLTLRGAF